MSELRGLTGGNIFMVGRLAMQTFSSIKWMEIHTCKESFKTFDFIYIYSQSSMPQRKKKGGKKRGWGWRMEGKSDNKGGLMGCGNMGCYIIK